MVHFSPPPPPFSFPIQSYWCEEGRGNENSFSPVFLGKRDNTFSYFPLILTDVLSGGIWDLSRMINLMNYEIWISYRWKGKGSMWECRGIGLWVSQGYYKQMIELFDVIFQGIFDCAVWEAGAACCGLDSSIIEGFGANGLRGF